ncbi:uncharacterized protein LOC133187158 isoform X2 [Saccostrea echinata]|uniref:uncharacterized protein LOC133187158 isoform X2 n=1 Tax=Saccostrea echinata TaxID=191078 RepID=UPI002A8125D9|nr:uncharacterized protein LOC133187158 isoform X2 [Saccostrea echinata]
MSKTYAFLPELKKVVKGRINLDEGKKDAISASDASHESTHKTDGQKPTVSANPNFKATNISYEPYVPDPDYPGAREFYKKDQLREKSRAIGRNKNFTRIPSSESPEPDPDY